MNRIKNYLYNAYVLSFIPALIVLAISCYYMWTSLTTQNYYGTGLRSFSLMFVTFAYLYKWVFVVGKNSKPSNLRELYIKTRNSTSSSGTSILAATMFSTIFLFIIIMVLHAVAFLLLWNTSSLNVEHSWDHEVPIEDYQARFHEGWGNTAPAGAFAIEHSIKRSSTSKSGVNCTKHTSGDSKYYECDYITYKIDEWGYERSSHNGGNDVSPEANAPFIYPDIVKCNGVPVYGCERYGGEIRHYYLTLWKQGDETEQKYFCEVDRDIWVGAEKSATAKFSMVDGNINCNSIKPS